MPKYIPIFERVREIMRVTGPKTRSHQAISWFQRTIHGMGTTPQQVVKDDTRADEDIFMGKLCMFFYDPKTKEKLPYYDKFPLVLPIEMYDDGFLGINFHYLPPKYRIALLDKLLEFRNSDTMSSRTRIKATYALLKGVSKFKEVAPCIKRYLASHVQSRFIVVDSKDWEIAVFLPVERFVKKDTTTVWKNSLAQAGIKQRFRTRMQRKNNA